MSVVDRQKSRPTPESVDWVREGLKLPGKSQKGLAEALGRSAPVVSQILRKKDPRPLKDYEIPIFEQYFGISRAALETRAAGRGDSPTPPKSGSRAGKTHRGEDFAENRAEFYPPAEPPGMARVYAFEGDPLGGWYLDIEAGPAEYAPPPGRYAQVRGLYGIIIVGDEMAPRFKLGEIAWVHPKTPPRAGDDVLFRQVNGSHALIGELVASPPGLWRARHHSSEQVFDLDRREYRPFRIVARD